MLNDHCHRVSTQLQSINIIIIIIKTNESAGLEVSLGDRRDVYNVWCGNLVERGHLEDVGVDGRMI
jgi:hypothetical protein